MKQNKYNERANVAITQLINKNIFKSDYEILSINVKRVTVNEDLSESDYSSITFIADIEVKIDTMVEGLAYNEQLLVVEGYADVINDEVVALSGIPYNLDKYLHQ